MPPSIPVRPIGLIVPAVFGAFVAAVLLGLGLARVVGLSGDLRSGIAVFGHLLIFFVGYKLWAGYAYALLIGGAGRRLLAALVAGLRRREPELRALMAGTLETLRDPADLAQVVAKIRARTAVFRTAGFAFGAVTGLALGLLRARAGVLVTFVVFTGAGWSYGYLLSWLAREGYLPLPEQE